MPWYSFKEISARFDDVHLIDTLAIDRVVERLSSLQRYGLSVRQRRFVSNAYGKIINARLADIKPDVVLSVGASHKLIRIDSRWPIVHVSDGLFGTMVNYYEKFGRFRQAVLRNGHDDLQHFIDKVDVTLFASQWAHDSASQFYDIAPEKMRVVPFGANLDRDPPFRPRQLDGPLSLLFVGYDWTRKGGETVLAAWREIRRAAPDTELHIVGCSPQSARAIEGVFVHGRLKKADPRHYALLSHLYERASVFFMPSREEAFGMVFCEAAAYGIPAVAALTGGVPTVIMHGETGILLPLETAPAVYAQHILMLWRDKARYSAMSRAARRRYEDRLNWTAWGSDVANALQSAVNSKLYPDRVEFLAES